MSKLVVANLFRLGRNGDKFSKDFKTTLRTGVVIDENYVNDFNKNWKVSGQFYEIDKEATDKRNNKLNGNNELEIAREKYKEKFGKYPDGRMK